MMNKEKTILILKALANGVDPTTGEVLPQESPYQSIDVNRALFNAVSLLESSKSFSIQEIRKKYAKAYAPWTNEDDLTLKKLYDNGEEVKQMASLLERQPGAIRSRLKKLNLV